MKKEIVLFENLNEGIEIMSHREMRRIRLHGDYYGLIRFHEDFSLIDSLCPHKGYSLIEDKIGVKPEVICGWHSYNFSLIDGAEKEHRCEALNVKKLNVNDAKQLIVVLD